MVKLSGMSRRLDRLFLDDPELPRDPNKEAAVRTGWSTLGSAARLHDYRVWQRKVMGFAPVSVPYLVEKLYGEAYTHCEHTEPTSYEEVWNHHRGAPEDTDWFSQDTSFSLKERRFLTWPPFSRVERWRAVHRKLKELSELPPGLVLRVLECKGRRLFNAYSVLLCGTGAILLGALWELPPVARDRTDGRVIYFFLGEWRVA